MWNGGARFTQPLYREDLNTGWNQTAPSVARLPWIYGRAAGRRAEGRRTFGSSQRCVFSQPRIRTTATLTLQFVGKKKPTHQSCDIARYCENWKSALEIDNQVWEAQLSVNQLHKILL